MRWIYISPHLDDAILSAGGLIYDQARAGTRVEIWTLACGFPPEADPSPFAQVLHFQWGFASTEETVRLRRAEDTRAASRLGAQAVHFDDFPDCIYRRGADGEPLYPLDVFVDPHPTEAGLPAKMTAALLSRLASNDVLVCPLGIGGHADHILVRRAVEGLVLPRGASRSEVEGLVLPHRGASRSEVEGLVLSEVEGLNRPLRYYADVPYVLNHPEALTPLVSAARSEVRQVSSAGLSVWVEGIAAYASQMSTLFESPEKMREMVETYGREGVCLWTFE